MKFINAFLITSKLICQFLKNFRFLNVDSFFSLKFALLSITRSAFNATFPALSVTFTLHKNKMDKLKLASFWISSLKVLRHFWTFNQSTKSKPQTSNERNVHIFSFTCVSFTDIYGSVSILFSISLFRHCIVKNGNGTI